MTDMKKVVFILGPTGVGKTFFGINLAKQLDGEIISADSVQIYRKLNIGSAKIGRDEMQDVVHHGIDIVDANQEFSVFDFVSYTKAKIDEIIQKGKLPIVVGGTGLYVKALVLGYNFGGVETDKEKRKELEKLSQEKGNDFLFEMLKKKNPLMAEKTDKDNTVRLIRALEIALFEGEKSKTDVDIDPLIFALNMDRAKLYENINKRVDIMLENGLVGEVEGLKNEGLSIENQSMKAIGYKEVLLYLNKEIDFDTMSNLIKQHSRNYAKRQITFLKGMENVIYVDVEDKDFAFNEILKHVENWKGI